MFSLTSSQKPGGFGPSGSFGSATSPGQLRILALVLIGLSVGFILTQPAPSEAAAAAITRAAANQCNAKLKDIENFASHRKPGQKKTTQFSEEEVNSYLALDLSPNYHPCLKSLSVNFEEDRLQSVTLVDFDRLGTTSTKLFPKLLSFMLSGVHTITARGQLVSGNGKASFRLEQARFDNSALPTSLVEEIISAVGRKQNPPIDPMQPSQLFDGIDKIDVHPGYILVHQ